MADAQHTTSDGTTWDLEAYGGDSPHVSACRTRASAIGRHSLDYGDSAEIDLTIDDLTDLVKAIHDHQRVLDAERRATEDRRTSKLAYLLAEARGTDDAHTEAMRKRYLTLGGKPDAP